ncbi:Gfo/Idh/MocA family oxidoreductase (plasmid) [Klebsiella michiganensis]|uniref:Gfo/Idh/MocA family oxidoreductase n=1 Tax=Klebsiella michiganensis TaxID=1134687 RepID=A0A6P1V7B6_9ENTR|nr:Gfo/Idh/MocA family oxidoreductase [Klebsiella michiganensis]QHS50040.1 Gfo/Idh/MocA family oxidoreductase [Klebsiella michiganensis]HDX8940951.1 Gfo/Idh/MocA family oxidoreductase [Klebsiella michiganensis]
MHVAIFGMGYWGKNILRNLLQFESIHKITICEPVSISPDFTLSFSDARLHYATRSSDIIQDYTIDAVFIVTPSETHFQIASDALQSGKHVFVEKPVTTSSVDLEALISLARKQRKILFPSHTYLYTKEIEKLKKMIHTDCLIGKPLLYQSNRSNFGRFRSDKNVAWDLAVHDLYIIKHIFSQQPISVSATGFKIDNNFPEVVSNININYDGGLNVSIVTNWVSPKKIRDIVIVGSDGAFFYDDCLTENKITHFNQDIPNDLRNVNYNNLSKKQFVQVEKGEAIYEQIRSFLNEIKNMNLNNTTAKFGLEIIKTLEAIDISIKNNGVPIYSQHKRAVYES